MFQVSLQALKASKNPDAFSEVYVDAKAEGAAEKFELLSKSQLKNLRKVIETEARKEKSQKERESEDAKRRQENMEAAKKIVIKEDPSLPAATKLKIKNLGNDTIEKRVKVFGWVHHLRRQGK